MKIIINKQEVTKLPREYEESTQSDIYEPGDGSAPIYAGENSINSKSGVSSCEEKTCEKHEVDVRSILSKIEKPILIIFMLFCRV